MRAFTELWDRVCLERYGVTDPKLRRMRYGVQVNSLGLTEAQPENNVPRIVLESLGVTLSKKARARALQLPGLERGPRTAQPWDQQWSLRIQQILAFESDLLEYGDIFEGSVVVESKTPRSPRPRGPSWRTCSPWAAPSRPSTSSSLAWWAARPSGSAASRPASSRSWASTASPRRRSRPWPPTAEGWNPSCGSTPPWSRAPGDVEAWRAGRDQAAVVGPSTPCVVRPRAPRTSCPPPSRWPTPGAPPASGPGPPGGVRRVPGPDRRRWRGRPPRHGVPGVLAGPRRWRPDRRTSPAPGGQAGTGRPLQRCRTDRRGCPGRRLRGRLPGHPPVTGPDRRRGAGRGRRRRRHLHPVGIAPRAGPRGGRPAPAAGVDAPVVVGGIIPPRTPRSWWGRASPGSTPRRTSNWPDDGRHARPGRGAPRHTGGLRSGPGRFARALGPWASAWVRGGGGPS